METKNLAELALSKLRHEKRKRLYIKEILTIFNQKYEPNISKVMPKFLKTNSIIFVHALTLLFLMSKTFSTLFLNILNNNRNSEKTCTSNGESCILAGFLMSVTNISRIELNTIFLLGVVILSQKTTNYWHCLGKLVSILNRKNFICFINFQQ